MSAKNNHSKPKRDFTKMKTPHTYAIIFFVVVICWILTFLIPAGKFNTHTIEYLDSDGETSTRTVLMADTFRYSYNLDTDAVKEHLTAMDQDPALMEDLGVDPEALDAFLATDSASWTQEALDELGLTDDVLYEQYGESIYDTSEKLHKIAGVWGTEDFGGFGFLNYVFEGLVTGDRSGSAVGICALILVVGGSFGIIMKTGAIDAGIYAFIQRSKGLERLALPLLFILFSLGGATFGMAEECIPFSMIMVPFVIALGYDSIVAVVVTYVASQVGNAASWMSPFSVAVAQGIAGIPVLSGASFRLALWVVVTLASAFQSGVADLAGTAVVVGMAKGILLVLGGSDADTYSTLNTILYGIGTVLHGVPAFIGAEFMYLFQSCFNLIVTSNSGQAALTMPIMAPLADLVGVSRQVAVLAFQLGAGFVDAFTPVSASLIGVLGVARIDWGKWARFQIKMQAFFFLLGTAAIAVAIAVNLQ